ncbi:hypothetical protein VIGAN_07199400, partial [Vigna angularis var. angularis]
VYESDLTHPTCYAYTLNKPQNIPHTPNPYRHTCCFLFFDIDNHVFPHPSVCNFFFYLNNSHHFVLLSLRC